MESSEDIEPRSLASHATQVSANAGPLAEQIRALETVVARYARQLAAAETAGRDWERTFNAIDDPICVVAMDYRLVFANAAYRTLFGAPHELGGRHYCYALADDQPVRDGQFDVRGPCADCPLPEAVRTGRPGFTQQAWRPPNRPDGADLSRIYQRWTYPVVSAGGTVDRVVEVLKDVTEQERMRGSVAMTEALREADRLKAELLGTVSHELRSPLTAIKGYAATLLRHERRLPREERHEFLEAIGEACDRLEVIINRLLEMSQLETGSIVPHLASLDVSRMTREAIACAEQRAQTSDPGKYVFSLRVRDGNALSRRQAPLLIEADPRLLRDALDNLLENAVKYSPEGGSIEVTLGVRAENGTPGESVAASGPKAATETGRAGQAPSAAPPEMLEIVVRDTGVGIPAEHLGRVFERFHRVDTRLTREVDGLGLGLAMCKRIAELHGGNIWAESVPGEGSIFHLVLPVGMSSPRRQILVPAAQRA